MPSTLERLASWHGLQCDGDWEHSYGIRIETLDNPGWSVKIDLTGTDLEEAPFEEYKEDFDHVARWLTCRKDGSAFCIACGPSRLEDALQVFLAWAEPRASERPASQLGLDR